MNAQQAGYWMGLGLGGAGAGAVAGLLPLYLGVRKDRTRLALGGSLASVVGGLAAGIIGAAVLAAIFSLIIRPWTEPATGATQQPPVGAERGASLGRYLVLMFLGQTILVSVFWSLFMSFWNGKSFMSVLVPAGAGFGLTMGIVMTVFMAVLLRQGTVSIRMLDRSDFLARLDGAAAKLRYRRNPKHQEALVYEPLTPLRTRATNVVVELGDDEAVISGPNSTLILLKREIEKA